MKPEEFDKILDTRLAQIKDTLSAKAKQYASADDRLHNFKVAGRRLNCTPERALIGMKEKHCVSVMDIVTGIDWGVLPSVEHLEEKIGDEICYLILLEALVKERLQCPK
jgi:hypothetical protein